MSNLLTICNCDNIRNKQSCLYSSSYIWHNSYSLFCWCTGKKCMFIPRLPILLQSAATKWSVFNFRNKAKALWRPMLVSYEQTVLPCCHSFTCLKQKEATLMKNKLSHYFTLPSLFSLPVPDILFSPHFTLQQSSFLKKQLVSTAVSYSTGLANWASTNVLFTK